MTALVATAAVAHCQSPDEGLLARFKEKVRQDMTGIPNYTCLETIQRARRERHARTFKPADTVRLEVSSVGGKELFAWPGSREFRDDEVTALVTSGTIGTGMFASFAQNLFVTNKGTLQFGGEESLAGHAAVRYDFHLTAQDSRWEIRANDADEIVAAKGSFWFDPVSLDLLRLSVHGESMPYSLRLEDAFVETSYARTHIGDAATLLPKQSALTMTYFSGEANRAVIEFSQCRAYRSESTISFDAPPPSVPEAPKPTVREVILPGGLLVPIELETAIDAKTATVGDTLRGRVVAEVRYQGDVLIPRGAAASGHLRRMGRGSSSTPSGWESNSPKSNGPARMLYFMPNWWTWTASRPVRTARSHITTAIRTRS